MAPATHEPAPVSQPTGSESWGGAVDIRAMGESDLDACMALKERIGWNQTRRDWEAFLALRPLGCFVAVADGAVVGTVTTTNYHDDFAWIGMVLVSPEHRRQGIGTMLLQTALGSLASCKTVRLDATPHGKQVYVRLGFHDEWL